MSAACARRSTAARAPTRSAPCAAPATRSTTGSAKQAEPGRELTNAPAELPETAVLAKATAGALTTPCRDGQFLLHVSCKKNSLPLRRRAAVESVTDHL